MITYVRKIFLLLMFAQVLPYSAFAGGENNISGLLSSWKNPVMGTCSGSNVGNATIGRYKDICKGNYSIDANSPSQCVLGDDMGMLMLVAREVNENGARFCITTIYAEKKKTGGSWTLYAESGQGAQACYWLCKPGFSGDGCRNTTPTGCDTVPLTRNDFDNYTMARDPQVEGSIAMFYWNQNVRCGGAGDGDYRKTQEHDMILVVSDWLPSGHGAWATPYVIRATREWKRSVKAGIDAWPAGESTLLCKNGYTANAAGNDCVAVDEAACALTQMCPNWSSNAYDEATMTLVYDSANSCYKYRCRESGYAFPSGTDRTCQPCTTNLRGGISPADGTCILCEIGKIFDENASTSGYCVTAGAYDKSALQYGTGQSKNTELEDQCWMIAEATAYSNCVKGIKTETSMSAFKPISSIQPVMRIQNGISPVVLK